MSNPMTTPPHLEEAVRAGIAAGMDELGAMVTVDEHSAAIFERAMKTAVAVTASTLPAQGMEEAEERGWFRGLQHFANVFESYGNKTRKDLYAAIAQLDEWHGFYKLARDEGRITKPRDEARETTDGTRLWDAILAGAKVCCPNGCEAGDEQRVCSADRIVRAAIESYGHPSPQPASVTEGTRAALEDAIELAEAATQDIARGWASKAPSKMRAVASKLRALITQAPGGEETPDGPVICGACMRPVYRTCEDGDCEGGAIVPAPSSPDGPKQDPARVNQIVQAAVDEAREAFSAIDITQPVVRVATIAARLALETASSSVPDGWRLVPIEISGRRLRYIAYRNGDSTMDYYENELPKFSASPSSSSEGNPAP